MCPRTGALPARAECRPVSSAAAGWIGGGSVSPKTATIVAALSTALWAGCGDGPDDGAFRSYTFTTTGWVTIEHFWFAGTGDYPERRICVEPSPAATPGGGPRHVVRRPLSQLRRSARGPLARGSSERCGRRADADRPVTASRRRNRESRAVIDASLTEAFVSTDQTPQRQLITAAQSGSSSTTTSPGKRWRRQSVLRGHPSTFSCSTSMSVTRF